MDFKIKQRPYLLELATTKGADEHFIRFNALTNQRFEEHLVLVDGVEVLFKHGYSISAIQCYRLQGLVKFVVFIGKQKSNHVDLTFKSYIYRFCDWPIAYVFSILERAMAHAEPYLAELE